EYEQDIPYSKLIEMGKETVVNYIEDGYPNMYCGDNMTMQEVMWNAQAEFWAKWSIVTGVSVPFGPEECSFSCGC
ncbi:MAG: hypothetical protein N2C14_00310, partial [Planctomycetales bacterium]